MFRGWGCSQQRARCPVGVRDGEGLLKIVVLFAMKVIIGLNDFTKRSAVVQAKESNSYRSG